MANSDVDGGAPSGLSASDDRKGFVVLPRRWVVERTVSCFRTKPASGQALREPCRNPGYLRDPRLYPACPRAACQGKGRNSTNHRWQMRDDEGRQIGW